MIIYHAIDDVLFFLLREHYSAMVRTRQGHTLLNELVECRLWHNVKGSKMNRVCMHDPFDHKCV